MEKANNYLYEMRNAVGNKLVEPGWGYQEREGHLKFAREVGYALADFNEKEIKHIIGSSYGQIYVTGCNLNPILDAKDWIVGLNEGYLRALDYMNYDGKKLYSQIKDLADMDAYYDKIMLDFHELQLTEEEAIQMLDEIMIDYNIKNIIDFKDEMLKLDSKVFQ